MAVLSLVHLGQLFVEGQVKNVEKFLGVFLCRVEFPTMGSVENAKREMYNEACTLPSRSAACRRIDYLSALSTKAAEKSS